MIATNKKIPMVRTVFTLLCDLEDLMSMSQISDPSADTVRQTTRSVRVVGLVSAKVVAVPTAKCVFPVMYFVVFPLYFLCIF